MKKNLTVEQHWKLATFAARQAAAQAFAAGAQEAAGHAHTKLLVAQQEKDTAQQAAVKAKTESSLLFNEIAKEIGAEGDPSKIKIHLEDSPTDSFIEWEVEDKEPA